MALILQMDPVARQVCMNAGSDAIMRGDGAGEILEILREYFASGAVDSVYGEAARCS